MSDKMRDEFEAWVILNWPNQSLDRFNPLHGVTEGEYMGFTVQHCWEAWQASRSAVVIELPSADEFDVPSFAHDAIVGCWNAIEAAGLKVKS